jgi:predicted transcriptional regulator
MEDALDDVEFLALSENRVEVLRLLAEEHQTRSELAAATGASQATLGRILGDFEDRAWIDRVDGGYVATATGELVATGITDLLSILDTERHLRSIVEHLPTEVMDFDLHHLADARITTPTQTRPNAPVKRLLALIEDADEVRAVSHAFNEQSLTAVQERTAAGDQTFQGVFSRSAIRALADDSVLRERLLALLSTDGVEIRICDAEVPLAVTIVDNIVYLLVRDDNGILQAAIDTDAQAVLDWAGATFGRYWDGAAPLTRDDFSD